MDVTEKRETDENSQCLRGDCVENFEEEEWRLKVKG